MQPLAQVEQFLAQHLLAVPQPRFDAQVAAAWRVRQQGLDFVAEDFGTAFCQRLVIPETTGADFCNRVLDVGGGRTVIAGIRFLGLNPDKPFFEIVPGFDLFADPGVYGEVMAAVQQTYRFPAKRWRLTSGTSFARQLPSWVKADKDMTWYVGHVADLPTAVAAGDRYRVPSLDKARGRFHTEIELFRSLQPHLGEHVLAPSKEEFADSHRQGLVRALTHQGEDVGLIVGRKSMFYGHAGVEVLTEIIFAEHRRQGFGKRLQGALIAALKEHEETRQCLLFGSIHKDNESSRRVALGCGREPTIVDLFLEVSPRT